MKDRPFLIAFPALLCGIAILTLAYAVSDLPAQEPPADEAAEMMAVLTSDDADLHAKAVACERLAVIGNKDAVAVLAPLLEDPQLSHYARYALVPIPDAAVDKTLRDALSKVEGELLVGVINSIGSRKDAAAIDDLKKFLDGESFPLASAAAAALGEIGNAETTELLIEKMDSASGKLKLACADSLFFTAEDRLAADDREGAVAIYDAIRKSDLPIRVKVAATYGAIEARGKDGAELLVEQLRSDREEFFEVGLNLARTLPGEGTTKALLGVLETLPTYQKSLLVLTLGDRGDKEALPPILALIETGKPATRIAAMESLAQLGDDTAVPVLLGAALSDDPILAEAAQDSLVELEDPSVDPAIVEELEGAEPRVQKILIPIAGERRIFQTVPLLFAAADEEDLEIRLSAVTALGETISLDQMTQLIDLIADASSEQEEDAGRAALKAACFRMPDRDACVAVLTSAMEDAPMETKEFLLDAIGFTGGDQALLVMEQAALSDSDALQDAATRVLGTWTTPDVASLLMKLAEEHPVEKYRIRALRGYIRVIRQLGVPDGEKVEMAKKAMAIADREQEQVLIIEALNRIPTPASLQMAVDYLDDPALSQMAIQTAVSISKEIQRRHPNAVAKAMKKVAEKVDADNELGREARSLLKKTQK